MAKLKAEFLQHYYDKKGVSLPVWLIAHIGKIHKINSRFPAVYNALFSNEIVAGIVKTVLGFAAQRKMPLLSAVSFEKWLKKNGYSNGKERQPPDNKPEIVLFLDEFTNFLDAEKGIVAAKLLSGLGYHLHFVPSTESGRTYISKGLLRKARKIANKNIRNFSSDPE